MGGTRPKIWQECRSWIRKSSIDFDPLIRNTSSIAESMSRRLWNRFDPRFGSLWIDQGQTPQILNRFYGFGEPQLSYRQKNKKRAVERQPGGPAINAVNGWRCLTLDLRRTDWRTCLPKLLIGRRGRCPSKSAGQACLLAQSPTFPPRWTSLISRHEKGVAIVATPRRGNRLSAPKGNLAPRTTSRCPHFKAPGRCSSQRSLQRMAISNFG